MKNTDRKQQAHPLPAGSTAQAQSAEHEKPAPDADRMIEAGLGDEADMANDTSGKPVEKHE